MTTANIVFGMVGMEQYSVDDLYRVFGSPEIQELETESGEPTGPEAPRYIVKALDFLSASVNHVSKDVKIIDFDQAFPAASPPKKLLGTPAEFLAPEVAVGRLVGPASDVWALGCSIFRMRSGESPFSGYEVTSPADLMRFIVRSIGNIPDSWGEILFDYDGRRPTTDHKKGRPLELRGESRPIIDLAYGISPRTISLRLEKFGRSLGPMIPDGGNSILHASLTCSGNHRLSELIMCSYMVTTTKQMNYSKQCQKSQKKRPSCYMIFCQKSLCITRQTG